MREEFNAETQSRRGDQDEEEASKNAIMLSASATLKPCLNRHTYFTRLLD